MYSRLVVQKAEEEASSSTVMRVWKSRWYSWHDQWLKRIETSTSSAWEVSVHRLPKFHLATQGKTDLKWAVLCHTLECGPDWVAFLHCFFGLLPTCRYHCFWLLFMEFKINKLLYDDFSFWLDCCCFIFLWCSTGGHKCFIRCVCIPKIFMAAAKMCAVRTKKKERNLYMNSHHLRGQTQHFSGLSGSITGTACHHAFILELVLNSHVHTIYMVWCLVTINRQLTII